MIKWIILSMNMCNSSDTFVKSTWSKQHIMHIIKVFDDTTVVTDL